MSQAYIFPCAGLSTRFPLTRPKWLLTTPSGKLVIERAVDSLAISSNDRLVFIVLQVHEERFNVVQLLKSLYGDQCEVLVLPEPTNGPVETVLRALSSFSIDGPFVVKDCDSFFSSPPAIVGNYVGVVDLRKHPTVSNIPSKGFACCSDDLTVFDLKEKSVCSNYILSGLYGFSCSTTFSQCALELLSQSSEQEIFFSHVMHQLLPTHGFQALEVQDYVDVGTYSDWLSFTRTSSTLFIDIDGVIVQNQSKYFDPRWGSAPSPIQENISFLLKLQASGAQFVFVTSRPESVRTDTVELLDSVGLKYHALIMGLNHSRRILINDHSTTNPYPSAVAVSLARNSASLDSFFTDL